jgi:hypothetical protein
MWGGPWHKDVTQGGYSLAGILVSAGLAGILSVTLMKMHTNSFSLQKKASIEDERLELKSWFRRAVSCQTTYEAMGQDPGECGSRLNQSVSLQRDDGSLVVEEGGSKVGNWVAKATCISDGFSVKVAFIGKQDANQVRNPSAIFKDPVTDRPLDFNHPKNDLFSNVPLCNSSVGSTLPDLECITAYRDNNGIFSEKSGVVESYTIGSPGDSSFRWGMRCIDKYNRVSCFMTSKDNDPSDMDLRYEPRTCISDDEEWDLNHELHIVCCKFRE